MIAPVVVVTPDILTLSRLACPSTSRTALAVTLVNVPAAGVAPPIIELSIVPPLMSAVVATNDPIVPKLVREEFITPDPKVVELRISVLLTFSTLPVARFIFSDDPQLSPVAWNVHVLSPSPESTSRPALSAAASLAAPSANFTCLSTMLTVVELTVVVVPSTCKLPAITTVPVLSPTAAGSRVRVAGPEIVFPRTRIADPDAPV